MHAVRWRVAGRSLLLSTLGIALGFTATVRAADFPELVDEALVAPAPRYFPRGEGEVDASGLAPRPARRRLAGCAPWRVPVPTDAPDDPSYVGSEYGLGKPSYYGFRPGLGRDDPFGRPLRYCP
ncbi:hypothetical protein [Methylobacterium haplocladii]|uniref:Uncharacterized protein n=1 Tax=Methylobacterium haplocladii TaxID=1176176 RepID=A0A512ILN9_9HYPH|nr:hypothetical protein [Methylobacterium haplocladii]GEO98627.1 hypothetical protein MHA02_10150 [Methylobacterium haplocladii]GJD83972.1 hypothetical protein HPGCJGGD_1847 [Methylobacterium haplocladii]GLS59478.1 hypothetical protein GCM10007887_21470 [Methylobacterium haplocladii]